MTIFRNSIQNGTEFLSSVTKTPSDDILEGLYKLRIRESEKLKTVSELYDLEIHQKKIGPDYHRLKTMVTRSIEQDIRNKNLGARRIKDSLQKHVLYCHHWSDEVEEQHGRRRRRQEKDFSVVLIFFRNNSLPPSSSRLFRMQSN